MLAECIRSNQTSQAIITHYNKELKQMKQATLDGEATKGGMVLKKQSSDAVQGAQEEQNSLNGGLIAGIVLVAFVSVPCCSWLRFAHLLERR